MTKLMRSLVGALLALAVGFSLAVSTAPQAAADTGTGSANVLVPLEATSACIADQGSDGGLLAATRWKDASSRLHDRIISSSVVDTIKDNTDRLQSNMGMMWGNFTFSLATWMVEASSRVCPLDSVGANIDKAAAVIGNAFNNSPIMAIGLAFGIASILVARSSLSAGRVTAVTIAKKVGVIALMSVMTVGAAASTTGADGHFKPGLLSPGWFITRIDQTVSAIAAAPVSAIADSLSGDADLNTKQQADSGSGVLSCQSYMSAMRQAYKDSYGSAVNSASATGPLLVSSLWESAGYGAWKKAQFGSNSGGFVDYAACRYLEMQANSPMYFLDTDGTTKLANSVGSMADIQSRASGIPKEVLWRHSNAVAWWWTLNNDDEDKAILAWASCKLTDPAKYEDPDGWSVQTGAQQLFRTDHQDEAGQKDSCYQFFNGDGDTSVLGAWDWSGDAATTAKDSGNSLASNFILAWQGRGATDQSAATAYALAGGAILVVFGVLAGGILVAKIAALFLMAMLFLSMAVATITNTEEKVLGLAKQYVGISLFAWMAQLVMALVAVLSAAMVKLATMLPGGQSGLFGLIWIGASPLIAVWVISKLFKEAGLPSPFSLKGALALGSASAAMGAGAAADGMLGVGAAAAGMGMGNRLKRRVSSTIGKSADKALGDKGWGALAGRFSRMKPDAGGGVGETVADMAKVGIGAGVGGTVAHAIDNVWDEKRERKARADSTGHQSEKQAAKVRAKQEAFDQWLADTGQPATRTPSTRAEAAAHRKAERQERWGAVRADFKDKPLQAVGKYGWGATKSVAKTAGKLGVGVALGGFPGVMVAGGAMLAQKTRQLQQAERDRETRLDTEYQAALMEKYAEKLKTDQEAAAAAKAQRKRDKKAAGAGDTQKIPVGAGTSESSGAGPKPGAKGNGRRTSRPK